MRELANILRQQYTVQRGNIDVEKDGIDFIVLQEFQHIETVVKGADDLHLAVSINQPG